MSKAQPVIIPTSSEDWPAVIDALYDLAASIRERYTIPAFTCPCGGAEPSCNSVLNNAADNRQQDTVNRIADWISEAAQDLDDRYNNGDGEDLPTGPTAVDNRVAIVAVRELHQPCLCCADMFKQCKSCYRRWPCPTQQVLDGQP